MWALQDVAEFTTTCERYVGTESGGMDQAISMMGMPQIAKLIEFNPVSPGSIAILTTCLCESNWFGKLPNSPWSLLIMSQCQYVMRTGILQSFASVNIAAH